MTDDIKLLLMDYEKYHSNFQIENFIIGSQGNAWAQYKQCLREIKSRQDNIQNLKDERESLRLRLEDLKKRRFRFQPFASKRKKNRIMRSVKIKSLSRKLADVEESLYHTHRESIRFVKIAKRIRRGSWGDAIITGALREKLEAQMWYERVQQMLAIDILSLRQVSKQSIEMLFKMPKSERKELLKMIKPDNRGDLIKWVEK